MLTNPLRPFIEVLRIPGALAFSSAGFVARLPLATVGLGLILFVSNDTGSYAYAGFLQALFAITSAVAALFTSRLADRIGQRPLLVILPFIYSSALIVFVAALQLSWSRWIQSMLIVIAGAAFPSFGSFVRARWAFVTDRQTQKLRSAFALESIIDELVFAIGPLLATTLAFSLGFPAPLIVGATLTLVGALLLASLKTTSPPIHVTPPSTDIQRGALRQAGLFSLVIATTGVGVLFGSSDVAVVAFAANSGTPEFAGLILSLWAVGSMLGGILFGSRQLNVSLPRQLRLTSLFMLIVAFPIPFLNSIAFLALAAFLSGFAIAPTLISAFSLAERLVPPRLLTEGLTWANSGLAVGFAGGASVGGYLIDTVGTSWAFALGVSGAAFTVTVSLASQKVWERNSAERPLPHPAIVLNFDPIPGPTAGGFVDDPHPLTELGPGPGPQS
jgi:MFS family permease